MAGATRRSGRPDNGTWCLLQTFPGLEKLLWREVSERVDTAERLGTAVLPHRNGLLEVAVPPDAIGDLLDCRISEDLFVIVSAGAVSSGLDGVGEIDRVVASADINDALRAHTEFAGGRGKQAVSTFRVVVRSAADRAYRRIDVQKRAVETLGVRLGRRWRHVAEGAQVEFWLTLLHDRAILAVRLTTSSQRRREKTAHIPGSLRPAVAAALVRLSDPRADDRVLDPFCGAGTILIERDRAGRHGLLTGSDTSAEALAAAHENIGARHQPLELHDWDATRLPLDAASVDAIITNPPFGFKVATTQGAAPLMRGFVAEAHRVVQPGGRIVVLTHDAPTLRRALTEPEWTAVRPLGFEVQGRHVTAVFAVRV